MTATFDRRDFVGVAGVAVAASVLATAAQAQTPPAPAGPYTIKPLPFDAKSIKGLSEKILTSHHDNNYAGAVRRLNTIAAQFAALDVAKAPVFTINGLKREELIAMNSMILHDLYFDSLGAGGAHASGALSAAIARDFGSCPIAGTRNSPPWARRKAAAPAGCC